MFAYTIVMETINVAIKLSLLLFLFSFNNVEAQTADSFGELNPSSAYRPTDYEIIYINGREVKRWNITNRKYMMPFGANPAPSNFNGNNYAPDIGYQQPPMLPLQNDYQKFENLNKEKLKELSKEDLKELKELKEKYPDKYPEIAEEDINDEQFLREEDSDGIKKSKITKKELKKGKGKNVWKQRLLTSYGGHTYNVQDKSNGTTGVFTTSQYIKFDAKTKVENNYFLYNFGGSFEMIAIEDSSEVTVSGKSTNLISLYGNIFYKKFSSIGAGVSYTEKTFIDAADDVFLFKKISLLEFDLLYNKYLTNIYNLDVNFHGKYGLILSGASGEIKASLGHLFSGEVVATKKISNFELNAGTFLSYRKQNTNLLQQNVLGLGVVFGLSGTF